MKELAGLRAVSLLRVSTDKQTGKDDKDIPTQRQLIREFIEKHELLLVREFIEAGVSGFKTKTKDRDALITIKEMALKKEFDVLVVYKSDRIGRISDESSVIVKFLNDCKIRIFTCDNEEMKTHTQFDKLMTYLNFWQNETESVKLSQRATDYHILQTKNGQYRGGELPYGYKLINNGSKNFKGRNIYDVIIDNEQAEVVKLIYDLSINNNMGARAISSFLNENGYKYMAKSEKGWLYTTTSRILKNPIYKGYFHMHSKLKNELVFSSKQKNLVIIDEAIWNKAQDIMTKRTTKGNTQTTGINQSDKNLLGGLVYCGHCGNKMNTWSNHKKYSNKNGDVNKFVTHRYRCSSSLVKGRGECEGQSTYSCNKIDSIVEGRSIQFIREINKKQLSQNFLDNLQSEYDKLINLKNEKEKDLENKQRKLITLKKEIPNAMLGESVFSIEDLKDSLKLIQDDVEKLLIELSELDNNINQQKILLEEYNTLDNDLDLWEEMYKKSTNQEKKVLLSKIINKVFVYRDEVKIEYRVEINTYKKHSVECNSENAGCQIDASGRAKEYNKQPLSILNVVLTVKYPIAS
ncbi:MAG: recombinase family protein [Bacilli bacterium]